MRDTIGKKIKVAVFRDVEPGPLFGYESIKDESLESLSCYVRTSEYVEVTFEPVKEEIVVDHYLAALDRAEQKARLELQKKLDEIAGQRAQLLALTHKPT